MKLETLQDGITHLRYLLQYPQLDNSYVIIPQTIVNYADPRECDIDYCTTHNIPLTHLTRYGSTFVLNTGDIVFLHCGNQDHFGIKWREYLKQKLQQCGLSAEIVNNDVLIDGYKCVGDTELNDIYVCCIAMKDTPELIKNICRKHSDKYPRGLETYGLTTAEVEKWYLDFVFYFQA